MTTIIGVRIDNRLETAVNFQKILTTYGCIIKTRLGLHETTGKVCAHKGIIILEVIDDTEAKKFKDELSDTDGIETQSMFFED